MQRINLFRPEFSNLVPFPNFRQGVMVLGITLVVLVIIVIALWLQSVQLSSQLDEATSELSTVTDKLEQLKSAESPAQVASLDEEITLLKQQLSGLRQLKNALGGKQAGQQGRQVFSQQFEGFARKHIDGVWLSHIRLLEAGNRIELGGFASPPESAPRYLSGLYGEKAFANARFGQLSLQRAESGNKVRFLVEHKPEDSQP